MVGLRASFVYHTFLVVILQQTHPRPAKLWLIDNSGIVYEVLSLLRIRQKLQSRFLELLRVWIFEGRRGPESKSRRLWSGGEVDAPGEQCLCLKDIRFDGCISLKRFRTTGLLGVPCESDTQLLTSGIISAGSVTSRCASSSLYEIKWPTSTSQ
jgi:hypothetical protein